MQQLGLELLVLADEWKANEPKEDDFEDRLKLALVASGLDPAELWLKDAADVPEDEDVEYDYSAVDWQQGSTSDWELMQRALAESRVQVSGEPEPDDGPPVPDMGEEIDREWQ